MNKEEKTYILLYQNGSKFINAYGMDAFILHLIFGYKVLDNKKCGFPDNSFKKVLKELDEKHISYQIIFKDKDPEIKKFKDNNYLNFKKEATEKLNLEEKINLIIEKIKLLNEDESKIVLDKIIKCLE